MIAIALPAIVPVSSPPVNYLFPKPTMKIRSFLSVVCALAVGASAFAAEPETELGNKMDKMGSAFRALRRQAADATKNADSLAKIAVIKENAIASLKLDPAKKKDMPAGEQKKFVADYQAKMKEFIALVEKVEAAFKANNNAEAEKLIGQMADAQKAGHKAFQKKKDKK